MDRMKVLEAGKANGRGRKIIQWLGFGTVSIWICEMYDQLWESGSSDLLWSTRSVLLRDEEKEGKEKKGKGRKGKWTEHRGR